MSWKGKLLNNLKCHLFRKKPISDLADLSPLLPHYRNFFLNFYNELFALNEALTMMPICKDKTSRKVLFKTSFFLEKFYSNYVSDVTFVFAKTSGTIRNHWTKKLESWLCAINCKGSMTWLKKREKTSTSIQDDGFFVVVVENLLSGVAGLNTDPLKVWKVNWLTRCLEAKRGSIFWYSVYGHHIFRHRYCCQKPTGCLATSGIRRLNQGFIVYYLRTVKSNLSTHKINTTNRAYFFKKKKREISRNHNSLGVQMIYVSTNITKK